MGDLFTVGSQQRIVRPTLVPAFLAFLVIPGSVADAGSKWLLLQYWQLGNQINANWRTIENHCFDENGNKVVGVGVTNAVNYDRAIFGFTDMYGFRRIDSQDANCAYDIRIYDPTTPTQQSPNLNWQHKPNPWPEYYTFVTHWMKVSDDSLIETFPNTPVYRYDQLVGTNQASGFGTNCTPLNWVEAPGANTDANHLHPSDGWQNFQAQTFVVPPGINRIISAHVFVTRGGGDPKTHYRATIHENSPIGAQVGGVATSRDVNNGEFKEIAVCWGLHEVQVYPGSTYALRVDALDGGGYNVYRTDNDNYPDGIWYRGPNPEPNHDMVAVIFGLGYNVEPPTINRTPSSFTRSAAYKVDPANDTFTIANTGGGRLNYQITDNASWLYCSPDTGNATTETDNIDIVYDIANLASGDYSATITIADPNASNTPQYITVDLTVAKPADFDRDGDVDLGDFGRFQACYSGPGQEQPDPACAAGRLDEDHDVDQDDYSVFKGCLSGAEAPSDPDCALP